MSKYSELIARLEKAPGPSRDHDVEIMLALGAQCEGSYWWLPGEAYRHRGPMPCLTSSIDAAVALINSKFRGVMWCLFNMEEPGCVLLIPDQTRTDYLGAREIRVSHQDPIRALNIALLRALEDQDHVG